MNLCSKLLFFCDCSSISIITKTIKLLIKQLIRDLYPLIVDILLIERPLPILPHNILNTTQEEHPTIIAIFLLWKVLIQHYYGLIQSIDNLCELFDIGEFGSEGSAGFIPLFVLPDTIVDDYLLVDNLYE